MLSQYIIVTFSIFVIFLLLAVKVKKSLLRENLKLAILWEGGVTYDAESYDKVIVDVTTCKGSCDGCCLLIV
jgi:hypothetical protein